MSRDGLLVCCAGRFWCGYRSYRGGGGSRVAEEEGARGGSF